MRRDEVAAAYLELARGQLSDEQSLKASLEQRATVVVTISSALITLSFAVVGIRTRVQAFVLPISAEIVVAIALALLILAAVVALSVQYPVKQAVVAVPTLKDFAKREGGNETPSQAAQQINVELVQTLDGLRGINRLKARLLGIALGLEVLAVTLVAFAAVRILFA